jgi:probable F420-dependent oxidoreductase
MKVGAVMPISERELAGKTATYAELREVAQTAEREGLDSIWVYDHLLFRFPPEPTSGIYEAWAMLAALAADTSRVEVGALVMALPFRNPAVFAKMAATVDEISRGRLILGIGCGWHEPEFEAFGIPFDHRVSRFEEGLQILLPLLRGEKASYNGRFHHADAAELRPRGPRPHGPPILIAGKGPRMLALTARYADAWNAAWFGSVSEAKSRMDDLHAALDAEGRDLATMDVTIGINVVFPELVTEADEVPRRSLSGGPSQIANGLREYADAGVSHAICACVPSTPSAIAALAEARRLAFPAA